MSAIAFPDFLEDPSQFSMRLVTSQLVNSSPYGGSEQVIDKLNDRWYATAGLPALTHDDAAEAEAWFASMRGMTNTVNLYHLQRPEPRGTMRGAPTVQAATAGAASVRINTTPGSTLRAGDMVGIGGLLLQVQSLCIADGAGLLIAPIVNRLRKALVAGTAVVWEKPSAPFRLLTPGEVSYLPGYSPENSIDFVEAIG